MPSPRDIATEALAYVQEHESEQTDSYWFGYLLATLERIAEM
jgi:hypothetical protein